MQFTPQTGTSDWNKGINAASITSVFSVTGNCDAVHSTDWNLRLEPQTGTSDWSKGINAASITSVFSVIGNCDAVHSTDWNLRLEQWN